MLLGLQGRGKRSVVEDVDVLVSWQPERNSLVLSQTVKEVQWRDVSLRWGG